METINNDFTQEDYDNLIIERNKLQKQQWLTGVDNSARIKEIKTDLNYFSSDDDEDDKE